MPSSDPLYASADVPPSLGPGVYTVVYDNLSTADGHRYQGFYPFIVLNPDGSQPAPAAVSQELLRQGRTGLLPSGIDVVLRWISLISAILLLGGAFSHIALAQPASRFLSGQEADATSRFSAGLLLDIARFTSPILLLAGVGQLLLLAERLGGLAELDAILTDTRPGALWAVRIGLAATLTVAAVLAMGRPNRQHRILPAFLLAGSIAIVAAYSVGSHAAGEGGRVWAVASDFIHFGLTGLWLGVLAHLAFLWRRSRSRLDSSERLVLLANLLDRFSAIAVISVAGLLLTGVFSAFVQLPSAAALWETTYGRVLLAKMALVIPLLGVAGINALMLKPFLVAAIDERLGADVEEAVDVEANTASTPELEARTEALRRRLSQTVRLEIALGALVVGSVAVLSQTGTAKGELAQNRAEERAAIAQAAQPHQNFAFNANKLADDLAVSLSIAPQLVGINTFEVSLSSAQSNDIGEVQDVSLRFFYNDPAFGSTSAIPVLLETDFGIRRVYQAEGAYFSVGGAYRVQVDIKRPGLTDARAIFPLQVEKEPDIEPGQFELPFTIGTSTTTFAILFLAFAGTVLATRTHWAFLYPQAKPVVELLGIGAVAISAALAVNAVVNPTTNNATNPVALTDDSVERGQLLFARNCAICHGDAGRGDGPGGVNLSPQPADFLVHVPYHSDPTLFGWISQGVQGTGMPAFADQLDEQERWDLVNFLRKNFGDELANQRILEQETPTSAP